MMTDRPHFVQGHIVRHASGPLLNSKPQVRTQGSLDLCSSSLCGLMECLRSLVFSINYDFDWPIESKQLKLACGSCQGPNINLVLAGTLEELIQNWGQKE